MNTKGIGTVSCALLMGFAAQAYAGLVTYDATATVSYVYSANELPPAFRGAAVGDTISLTWTVDTNAAGTQQVPNTSIYTGALTAISAQIGSSNVAVDISSHVDTVTIAADSPVHTGPATFYDTGYAIVSNPPASFTLPPGFTGSTFFAGLTQVAQSTSPLDLYANTSLSNAPLAPASANVQNMIGFNGASYINGVYQAQGYVDASITSISTITAPVPLPAPALLLGSGVLALVGLSRRRKAA